MFRSVLFAFVASAIAVQPSLAAPTKPKAPISSPTPSPHATSGGGVQLPSPFEIPSASPQPQSLPAESYSYSDDKPYVSSSIGPLPKILFYGTGLGAATLFMLAGSNLGGIKSVAGNTTAEAYYQGMGTVSYGFSLLTLSYLAQQLIQDLKPAPQTEE